VILLIEHENDGTLGIILNQQQTRMSVCCDRIQLPFLFQKGKAAGNL
jgi:putative AlgH/UPF0301 family transcriptional regulator